MMRFTPSAPSNRPLAGLSCIAFIYYYYWLYISRNRPLAGLSCIAFIYYYYWLYISRNRPLAGLSCIEKDAAKAAAIIVTVPSRG